MNTCNTHGNHDHQHAAGCGHRAVQHEGHVCYLHDGHLHHTHGDHHDEHVIAEAGANPARCTAGHACSGNAAEHKHGAGCGHDSIPHGDHSDYLVDNHLHHAHGTHCDDHGPVNAA